MDCDVTWQFPCHRVACAIVHYARTPRRELGSHSTWRTAAGISRIGGSDQPQPGVPVRDWTQGSRTGRLTGMMTAEPTGLGDREQSSHGSRGRQSGFQHRVSARKVAQWRGSSSRIPPPCRRAEGGGRPSPHRQRMTADPLLPCQQKCRIRCINIVNSHQNIAISCKNIAVKSCRSIP